MRLAIAGLPISPILRAVVDVEDFDDFSFYGVDHNVRKWS
jgi:hypothetical protein